MRASTLLYGPLPCGRRFRRLAGTLSGNPASPPQAGCPAPRVWTARSGLPLVASTGSAYPGPRSRYCPEAVPSALCLHEGGSHSKAAGLALACHHLPQIR